MKTLTCHYCGATTSECCRGECECAKDFAGCLFYLEQIEASDCLRASARKAMEMPA